MEAKRLATSEEQNAYLQAKVEKLTEDLDLFAYVMSHNLIEPVRELERFGKELQQDTTADINIFVSNYLAKIERLKELFAIVLEILNIEKITTGKKPVDMNEIMAAVLEELKDEIAAAGATVLIGDLPVVNGRRTQFIRLFKNIIQNGIKFRGDDLPLIHIAATVEGNCWKFTVKDNGKGIEDEFQEIIFVLFQRVPSEEEYEGIGAGLAICKKIVEAHDGNIWVESCFGKGSTFCFTIPQ